MKKASALLRRVMEGKPSKDWPPPSRPIPPSTDQAPCTIVFGHNVADRKVCMLFNVAATQLIFTPEEAEDVARKLQHYAKAARGEKPS